MKKILLTGSNGFVGKNIVETLGDKYNFVKVSRASKFDILNLDSLLEINDVDAVIHAAAKTFVPESFNDPYSFYDFNIQSTLNIAEFCRLKNISKVIYFNSYMYGQPNYLPIDEQHPLSFHSPYNKSKYLAEKLLINYLEKCSNVISLRMFNVYGKHQNSSFLIPFILDQVKKGKVTVKDLRPKRDYIYIKDIISLVDRCLEVDLASGIFNVGSGVSHSVEEIMLLLKQSLPHDFSVSSEKVERENEVMDCYANIDKIKLELGWEPAFSLKAGLEDYCKEFFNAEL